MKLWSWSSAGVCKQHPMDPIQPTFYFCIVCELWIFFMLSVSSVQSLSRVWLFATPWIAAHQASLSITISRSSLRNTSIESVMPSSRLILCRPVFFLPPIPPTIRVFSNELTLHMSGQSIGVSASASVLPMNTQDWSLLGWTGWNSLQSKGLARVFSSTTQTTALLNSFLHLNYII